MNKIYSYSRRVALALRLRGPLAGDVRARTLHGLVVGLLLYIWLVHLPIIAPFFVARKAGSTLANLYLTLIYGITLAVLRRGLLRRASLLFLAGTWVAATVFVVFGGGIQSTALVHYVNLPLLAAWLLGASAAGVMTAVCLGGALLLAILAQSGYALPHYFLGAPFGNWSSVAMATLGTVVPVLCVLSALNEALENRKKAEDGLRQANEMLEQRVRERTAQLEAANDLLQSHLDDQKRLEAGLKLGALFPGENPNPVMRLGGGHLVDFANPPAHALLRTLGCTVAGEAPAHIAEPAVAALKDGVPRQIEKTYSERTYLLSFAPIPQGGYVNLYATDITDRKRAEEALQKREAENRLLADLLENSDQPFAVGYTDGRLGILNGAFERLTGYSRAELSTADWTHTLTPSEWREIEHAKLEELHRTGQPVRYEKEYIRKDGSRVPIELLVHLRRNDEGQPAFYYSFLTDLTARKQAEAALRESESRERARAAEFEALMEAAPVGIFVSKDTECRWMSGNQAAYDLLRRPRGSNLSKTGPEDQKPVNFRAMSDGKEIPPADLVMPKAAATGQTFRNREMDFEFEDGSTVNVLGNVVPLLDEKGCPRGAVGAFVDITGLKRAKEALQASEQRFRVLAEAIPQIIWTADATGARDYYNASALDYTGVEASQLEGWNWTSIIHPSHLEETLAAWRRAVATRDVYETAHQIRRADGEFRWHLTRAVPLRNEQGEVTQWIGSSTDIHERKMAEQELERRVAERTAELARSTALLENVTSNAPVVLIAADARGVFTVHTGRGVVASGRKPGELVGKDYRVALGEVATAENIRRALAGESFTALPEGVSGNTFETRYNPVRDAEGNIIGMIGVGVDITERTRAEAALRESQALMSSIVDSTSDLIWSVEPECFGLLSFNAGLRDNLLRRGVHLRAGMRPEDVFADADLAERWRGMYQRALAEGSYTTEYESPTAGNMVVTVNLLKRDGQVNGISVFAKDITRRVRAERELQRLNRALRALSASNQAMVRAQDESELLHETCRILVDEGGYRMAWVGLADQDAAKTVRPVAHAGFEEGYLEEIEITWADDDRGQGPTGTAIRTGQFVVCQNMLEDPKLAPWREEAKRKGYTSSCALPLRVRGKSIGALTVYSRFREAFDSEEADLLAELGADVAFGIESLRARAERQSAMEALQKSESRYKNFISHTSDGIWRIELAKPLPVGLPEDESLRWLFEQGHLAECNPAYTAIYGCPDSDQLVGKQLGELVPTWDEARIESFRGMVRGGFQTRTIELRARDAAGRFRDLLRTEVPIVEDGLLLRFWGITSDITERKRRETELRRLNRALRILSSSNHALVRAQAESQLPQEICRILVEEGGYRMAWMGFAEHDAEKTLRPVASAGVEEGYLESVKLSWADTERGRGPGGVAIRTGKPSVCDNVLKDPQFALWREDAAQRGYASTCALPMTLDDQTMAVLAVYSPVPDAFDAAEVKLLAELGDDISYGLHVLHTRAERQQAEEEVRRLNEELEQRVRLRTAQLEASNKELESFSYSVSHDLRAPLRAMDGFSRILMEEYRPQLPATAQRYLDFVRDGACHMGNLIDGLLALSRLGRQELKRRPVEVAEIVRQSTADLRADLEGSGVELVVGALPSCDADPLLLRQVFVNLLSNALKFSRQREKARIEIGALKAGEAARAGAPELQILDPQTWVYFVRDNGVGFDMRYADKLFGVFQRLHRQEEFKGTGIGLATVQQIVHKHGGQVWAEAEVGKGATFYFTVGETIGETNNSRSGAPV